jgi:uncharacterized membrane protein
MEPTADTGSSGAVATPKAPWSPSTLLAGAFLLAGFIIFLSFAPTPAAFHIYLAFHVVLSVLWVGGDITLTTLGLRYERLQDGPTLAVLGKVGTWIGTRVYTPALFGVIAFGLAMMFEGNIDWDQFWVIFGLIGWTIAAVVGVGFVGPELGRIDETAQRLGPDHPETQRRVKRLFMIFRFDTALLILIVIDMTARPTF